MFSLSVCVWVFGGMRVSAKLSIQVSKLSCDLIKSVHLHYALCPKETHPAPKETHFFPSYGIHSSQLKKESDMLN